jgi:hypothetical protein
LCCRQIVTPDPRRAYFNGASASANCAGVEPSRPRLGKVKSEKAPVK